MSHTHTLFTLFVITAISTLHSHTHTLTNTLTHTHALTNTHTYTYTGHAQAICHTHTHTRYARLLTPTDTTNTQTLYVAHIHTYSHIHTQTHVHRYTCPLKCHISYLFYTNVAICKGQICISCIFYRYYLSVCILYVNSSTLKYYLFTCLGIYSNGDLNIIYPISMRCL